MVLLDSFIYFELISFALDTFWLSIHGFMIVLIYTYFGVFFDFMFNKKLKYI